jgi:hypothetical protein
MIKKKKQSFKTRDVKDEIWVYKKVTNVILVCIHYCQKRTVAAINLETPRFFYCKLFVTFTMLLTYQFRLRQSVECAQR